MLLSVIYYYSKIRNITFKGWNECILLRLKWSKYIRSISTRNYISRIDFVAAISKSVRRKGGARNGGGVDKCQGNGRGLAKTLIEKRFPSTVRKSNITRATSDSFSLPSVRWSFFNPSYRVKLFKSRFPLNCRGIFRLEIFFEIVASSIHSSHRLLPSPRFSKTNKISFHSLIPFFFSIVSSSRWIIFTYFFEFHFIFQYNYNVEYPIFMEVNILSHFVTDS